MINKKDYKIAYFSMEVALEEGLETYAGGLGILAGDLLRSAHDLGLPMIGLSLLNNKGYFDQSLDKTGEQTELPEKNFDFSRLKKMPQTIRVNIGTDEVVVGAWQYLIDSEAPIYLLDTNIPENKAEYQNLTSSLYGGDKEYRLKQEIILGRGGVKMLSELGYDIHKFHINEGHGIMAAIELFSLSTQVSEAEKIKEVRKKIVFTIHTSIKAAQDILAAETIIKNIPDFPVNLPGITKENKISLTDVGVYFSNYVSGVSLSHKNVLEKIFPDIDVHAVTNGVRALTWTAPEFQALYDKYIPGWRMSSSFLVEANSIPLSDLWQAHQKAKERLLDYITQKQEIFLKAKTFTIGFARRFTAYKRPLMLLTDIDRLLSIHQEVGKIQIIYAGKAHPNDLDGKKMIKEIYRIKEANRDKIDIVFLEDYEMSIAKLMVAGVDLWLSNPLPPNEASGTSGMKAAHNGVPQLSTFDGWWVEGYIKDKTGWLIEGESADLYNILEQEIIPMYYNNPETYQRLMRSTISLSASVFSSERALRKYNGQAYQRR